MGTKTAVKHRTKKDRDAEAAQFAAIVRKKRAELLAREVESTTLSDAEVNRYCDIWRKDVEKPQRLEVLRTLIEEAWNLVCYLREAGLKFRSSSLDQAALTIAGCAYAEWMHTVVRDPADYPRPGDPARIAEGFSTGIKWALWMGDGLPSLQADSYTWRAERSDSAIDRMNPLDVVGKLWPDMVKDGKLNLPTVGVQPIDPDAPDACFWEYRPNILTASFEEVKNEERKSRLRDDRRRGKAMAEKRSKAKPRAK